MAVVEDLDVLEDRVRERDSRLPAARVESSTCIRDQNASIIALSKQSPTEPIDGSRPDRFARSVNV